jgi:glycosyltransferase involved in cell wall biosynthesis
MLVRAVDSVLRQHGSALDEEGALEVIVVDDASSEDIAAALSRYGGAVAMLRNESSRERGASRNLGASKASGRWLAFLDSDDEWEDEKLSAQLAAIGTRRACVTGSWLIDEKGGLLGMGESLTVPAAQAIQTVNPFRAAPSSLLIDPGLFQAIGGFPEELDVQGSEDWLLMVKLLHAGVEPVHIPNPLVRYRIHGGNSTASPGNYLPTTLSAVEWLRRHGHVDDQTAARARADKFEVAARAYGLRGELKQALACMWKAMSLKHGRGRLGVLGRTLRAATRTVVRRLSANRLEPSDLP